MRVHFIHTSIVGLGLAIAGLGCQQPSQVDKTAATSTLMDLEGQAWAAIRDRQPDTFKGLVVENFLIVSSWGTQDLNQKVADINNPNFTLKEFTFSDMNVTFPTKKNAIVNYKANYKYIAGNQEGGDAVNCSTVWVNHEKKWLAIHHTESLPAKD